MAFLTDILLASSLPSLMSAKQGRKGSIGIFMDIGPVVLAIPIYFLMIGMELIYKQVKSRIFEKRAWLFVSEILRMFALPILVHHYIGPE